MKRFALWLLLSGMSSVCLSAESDAFSMGLGVSKLTYREPSLGVTREAWLPTLQGQWSPADWQSGNWPIRLKGQLAAGHANYAGTGTMDHQPMQLFQLQVESPQSQWVSGYLISPGLGYRQLYSDARGVLNTGAGGAFLEGYRRTSEYGFASLGVEHVGSNGWRWSGQFRYLLAGKQTTQLGDISSDLGKLGTVTSAQHKGYGLHMGVCKMLDAIEVCPSAEYWRISESDTLSKRLNGDTYLLTEPTNTTKTYQLLVHYKF